MLQKYCKNTYICSAKYCKNIALRTCCASVVHAVHQCIIRSRQKEEKEQEFTYSLFWQEMKIFNISKYQSSKIKNYGYSSLVHVEDI